MSDCLKKKDCSTYGDIQGVQMAQHGDANVCISFFSPQIGQSRRFCSHYDGGRACHRSVVIEAGVLQLCSQYLYAFLLEESDTFLCAASHTRNREERSYCRTDEIGVVEVSKRVTDYDCISPSSIGTSKYCSEVSRLFHALQNHDKWRRREFQIGKPRVSSLNHSHYSFCPATIGDSFVHISSDRNNLNSLGQREWSFRNLLTDKRHPQPVACCQTMFHFATALYDKEPFCPSLRGFLLK